MNCVAAGCYFGTTLAVLSCFNDAFANPNFCADLSHVSFIGVTKVVVTQESCNSWNRQMFDPEGNPYGQTSKIEFSDQWISTEVDDNYEKYSARHRWFWSPNGQVIIHDFNIDSLTKETGEKRFKTISETFVPEAQGVRRKGTELVRTIPSKEKILIQTKENDELVAVAKLKTPCKQGVLRVFSF